MPRLKNCPQKQKKKLPISKTGGRKLKYLKINIMRSINKTKIKLTTMKTLSLMTAACFFICSIYADNRKDLNLQEAKKMLNQQKQEVVFLENKGQMMDMNGKPVPFVLFKTVAPGLNVWITEKGITYQTIKIEEEEYEKERESKKENEANFIGGKEEEVKIYWERIDMELKGANIKRDNIIAEGAEQGHFNYFYPHCPDGIYGVKAYKKITIKEVYPGIDWVLYNSSEKGMKYDFVVHPGADYKQIQLVYKSKKPLKINKKDEVEINTHYGDIKENMPVSFYEGKEITTKFKQVYQKPILINGDRGYETAIEFEVAIADNREINADLIIDPQLYWATFYGGSTNYEGAMNITADGSGNVFITGYVRSTDFPLFNPGGVVYFQGTNAGGLADAFILKFNNTGTLLWATYYGGNGNEIGYSIAINGLGYVFITGRTSSTNLPMLNPGGGVYFQGTNAGDYDIFILKFSNNGVLQWATYYGGSSGDWGFSISSDGSGNLFVIGRTFSANFPVLNPGGGVYYQGIKSNDFDVFIVKFNNTGVLLWATYYGGNGSDMGYSLTTDVNGNVFVVGITNSGNFPVFNPGGGVYFQNTNGGQIDAFILKFSNIGVLLWATYYGGGGDDWGYSIVTDDISNLFVSGYTSSPNFPVLNPGGGVYFQGSNAGGVSDAYILKFSNTGILLWATYFGGSGDEGYVDDLNTYDNLAIDKCGNVYMSFNTNSTLLPFQNSCDLQYFDNTYNGDVRDVFLVLFSNIGNIL